MGTVILSCSSLERYVAAAQKCQGTSYPVVYLDKKHHVEPKNMRQCILEAERALPADVDTVLVAMGFCGGSWEGLSFARRVVIPRVDDCISLLLQTGDAYIPNLKETGHMYMVEMDPNDFDMKKMFSAQPDFYPGIPQEELMRMIFGAYHHLDIVDTGLTDCYSEDYVMKAQENADLMQAELDYVPGSNHLLEKLVGGNWGQQFLIAQPGHKIRHGDFF